jgi:histidinol-phosphate aminotransferase
MIRIPHHIQILQPYIAGKPIEELAREKNLTHIVKLASNENPHGSSPKALAAVSRVLAESFRYVDPGAYELVHKIATKYGLAPDRIICGSGVDALLGYMVKAFTEEGDEVLTSAGTFIGIYVNTAKHARTLVTVPLKRYGLDLDALTARISSRTRIIYLANPNNPTGTIFSRAAFESFMTNVPSDILVILDEAYYTYAKANPEYPNGLSYDRENLIVTRTFSKDYGLAGLRLGFAAAQPYLIRELYKVKLPFEPNYLAQQAAIAALDDDEFLQKTTTVNARNLLRMAERFAELGIEQVHSDANFILLLMPSEPFAVQFNLACLDEGLIVRHVRAFGIPNGIRINTGTDEETEFALNVVAKVYANLKKSESLITSPAKG